MTNPAGNPSLMDATGRRRRGATAAVGPQPDDRRIPPVVLVMGASVRSSEALVRAGDIARRIEAPLFVAGCLAAVPAGEPARARRDADSTRAASREDATCAKRIWRWCNRHLVDSLPAEQVRVLRGGLAGIAAKVVRETGAQLVVVPEEDVQAGDEFAAIVVEAGVSVLLARASRPRTTLLAAAGQDTGRLSMRSGDAGSVLDLARQQEADLVVVGHRRRTWIENVFGREVAAGMAGQALRTVRVVPVARPTRNSRGVMT